MNQFIRSKLANIVPVVVLIFSISFLSFYSPNSSAESKQAAPSLQGVTGWVNSEPLTVDGLKGKVVMVEFWSSNCPNCMNALPHVLAWNDKYAKSGLVIIGVQVPAKGKNNIATVKKMMADRGIKYPVAMDINHTTAKAYNVHQLPTYILIDKTGNSVYRKVGAGDYKSIENKIKNLLSQ